MYSSSSYLDSVSGSLRGSVHRPLHPLLRRLSRASGAAAARRRRLLASRLASRGPGPPSPPARRARLEPLKRQTSSRWMTPSSRETSEQWGCSKPGTTPNVFLHFFSHQHLLSQKTWYYTTLYYYGRCHQNFNLRFYKKCCPFTVLCTSNVCVKNVKCTKAHKCGNFFQPFLLLSLISVALALQLNSAVWPCLVHLTFTICTWRADHSTILSESFIWKFCVLWIQ